MSVGSHIFHAAIEGLLKSKTRVVVLSSHLHLLEQFDQIIVIDKQIAKTTQITQTNTVAINVDCANSPDAAGAQPVSVSVGSGADSDPQSDSSSVEYSGCIVATGTFHELKGPYAALMSQRSEVNEEEQIDQNRPEEEDDEPIELASTAHHQSHPLSIVDEAGEVATSTPGPADSRIRAASTSQPHSTGSRLAHRTSSRDEANIASATAPRLRTRASSKAAAAVAAEPTIVAKAQLIEKEDRAQGSVDFSLWISYFSGGSSQVYGVFVLCVILFLFLVSQCARVACDMWLSIWSEQSVLQDKSTDFWIAVYFLIVAAMIILAATRSAHFAIGVALRSSRRIHDHAFKLLMRGSIPQYFDTTPIGRILNRFSSDLDRLDSLLPTTFFQFTQNVFILLGVIGVCISGSYIMIALFVPIGFLFFAVQRYFRNSQRELKRIENTTRSPIFSLFAETLQGLTVIRAYGVEEEFKQRNRNVTEQNSKV